MGFRRFGARSDTTQYRRGRLLKSLGKVSHFESREHHDVCPVMSEYRLHSASPLMGMRRGQ